MRNIDALLLETILGSEQINCGAKKFYEYFSLPALAHQLRTIHIEDELNNGAEPKDIAVKYGCSVKTVKRIRDRWKKNLRKKKK